MDDDQPEPIDQDEDFKIALIVTKADTSEVNTFGHVIVDFTKPGRF